MIPYLVTQSDRQISVTTRYVLVDLSDVSGFPHKNTDHIELLTLGIQAALDGVADWSMRIGYVLEVDADNGSVNFIDIKELFMDQSAPAPFPHYFADFRNPRTGRGISLDPTNPVVLSPDDVAGSTNWQTDVTLANPTGVNVAPGAGDLVIELQERSGTETLSFSVSALYGTP